MAYNSHKKDKNNLNYNSSRQTGANADKWVKNDQTALTESTNSTLFDKNETNSYGNYKDSNAQQGSIPGNQKPKKKHPKSGMQKFGLSDSHSSLGSSSGTQQIFHQSETFHPHSTQMFVEKPQTQEKLENVSPTLISCSGSEANGTPRNTLGVQYDNASWQNSIETCSENSQSSNYQSQSSFSRKKKKYDHKNQTNYSNNSYQNNQGQDKYGQNNTHWDNSRQLYQGNNNPRGEYQSTQKKTNYRDNVIFYEKTDTNQSKQQGTYEEVQKEPENRNNGSSGKFTELQSNKQIRSNVEKQILQTQASNSLQYPALSIGVSNSTQSGIVPTTQTKQTVSSSSNLEVENTDKRDSQNSKVKDQKLQSHQQSQSQSQIPQQDDCISFRVLTGNNNNSKGHIYVSVNSYDLSEESFLEEKISEQLATANLEPLTIINLKLKIVEETLHNLLNGSLNFVQDYENALNTLVKLLHFYTSAVFNPQNDFQSEDFSLNTSSLTTDQSSSQLLLFNSQPPISPQSPYGFQNKSYEIKNNNNSQQYQQLSQQSQNSYPFPQSTFIPSLSLPIQYMQQPSYPQYPPNYYPAQPFPIPQFYQNQFFQQPYQTIPQQKQQQPPQQKQQRGQYSSTISQGINNGNSYVPQSKKNFNKVGGGYQKNQPNFYFEEETNNS